MSQQSLCKRLCICDREIILSSSAHVSSCPYREIALVFEENGRLREALQHIADGNISPSIIFARHILAGDSVDEAHKKQVSKWE